MERVKMLGIVGSPRKNGNTAKLVAKALEAASAFPWVETDLFEVAGKKISHCVSCYKCMDKGQWCHQGWSLRVLREVDGR